MNIVCADYIGRYLTQILTFLIGTCDKDKICTFWGILEANIRPICRYLLLKILCGVMFHSILLKHDRIIH